MYTRSKARRILVNTLVLALLLALTAGLSLAQSSGTGDATTPQAALGTGFTFQGQLEKDDGPVSDDCLMEFRLFDDPAAGSQVGSVVNATVAVNEGLFSVDLDFGVAAFAGDARWLEIQVNCTGDGSFINLGRQALTATPYALYALAAPWSGLTGIPGGFDDGIDNNTTYAAGSGLSLTSTTFNVVTATIQQRVTGQCTSGNAIRVVNDDGTVVCQAVSAGGAHDHWGQIWTGASGTGLSATGGGTGFSGNGTTTGVLGSASSTTGRGVYGYNDTTTGETTGVGGRAASSSGRGVHGHATSTSGTTSGVYGVTDSPDGRGVYGHNTSTSGVANGVRGQSDSALGRGVTGYGFMGVFGESSLTNGTAVFGSHTAASGTAKGVYGESDSTSGRGVDGKATAGSGTTYGVRGEAASTSGRGVYGTATSGSGTTYGVYGVTSSTAGRGVFGDATAGSGDTYGVRGDATSPDGHGVHGYNDASSGEAIGVYGSSSVSSSGRGVYGIGFHGLYGETYWGGGYAVYGINQATSGTNYGVYGETADTSGTNYGIYGKSNSNSGYGGYFINSATNGIALYATGSGSASSKATLRVENTETTDGVAGYLSNDSAYATAKFKNSGSGHVLYLQNAGGDFINATNAAENDTQFRVASDGTVYSDKGYHCGNDIIDTGLVAPVPVLGQNDTSLDPCLQDLSPADFAEMMPALGSLSPGDVLVIGSDGNLTPSHEPYQTTVAGVYSFRPSFLGNAHFADDDGYVPLAMLGVVPVKASAENGRILPGDLLVSSTTPGHAMKANENPPQGTVIGKALGPLTEDTGYIQMLVTLQ